MFDYDIIVIGGGPAGYVAASYGTQYGKRIALIEKEKLGGCCLNVGCIPTKTYVHSASFDEARERMATVVSQLRQGVESILSHPNITLVRENGAFVDTHTVGDYTAPNIIIATGSETKWLPIEGRDDPHVIDSTGLLNLDTLPKRLAIIGAGVIGMEFASVFHRFGSEVTVIEFLKECLPALDSDIAKRLRKQMERLRVGDGTSGMKEGITFNMQCGVKQIIDGELFYENKKGQTESVEADVILMATGRKPRTEGLNLEALGVTLARNGAIEVDDNFQLPLPSEMAGTEAHIYAIGDVNGKQMLAHAAEMQAVRAVNHILGKQDGIRFDIMPAAIFTSPEAACVGPTEDQLKEQGIAYECRKSFWRANGKALAMGETEGLLKLFYSPLTPHPSPLDEPPGLILGAHAYGAHAADIIQQVRREWYVCT